MPIAIDATVELARALKTLAADHNLTLTDPTVDERRSYKKAHDWPQADMAALPKQIILTLAHAERLSRAPETIDAETGLDHASLADGARRLMRQLAMTYLSEKVSIPREWDVQKDIRNLIALDDPDESQSNLASICEGWLVAEAERIEASIPYPQSALYQRQKLKVAKRLADAIIRKIKARRRKAQG